MMSFSQVPKEYIQEYVAVQKAKVKEGALNAFKIILNGHLRVQTGMDFTRVRRSFEFVF